MPYFIGGPIARNDLCPLCHRPDSTSHLLNGCLHPEMKAMQIERHNVAGRLILKEMLHGRHGNHHIVADIGRYDKVKDLGVHDNRVNESILSDRTLVDQGESLDIRDLLRPDIMTVSAPSNALEADKRQRLRKRARNSRTLRETRRGHTIRIVEIGYTSEGRYMEKVQEKNQQHEKLQDLLKTEGHRVQQSNVILGSSGGIFKSTLDTLEDLGIVKERRVKLAKRLHEHSIKWLHAIVTKRRTLESSLQTLTKGRQKKPPDR